ncbi:MAG: sodium/proton-translocating pyrophosphatase [Ignavibacteriaceae bacterium]|jgi:K(+)-stimulated pyrophosphate-energized sodium pump|nr:sodium/proton-translocating pyrophosphatase [Ignavibacteriaceae bacterium]
MDLIIYLIPAFGVIGLLYTLWRSYWIKKQDSGNEEMIRISKFIAEGAMAFLKAEYRVLVIFIIAVAIL